MTKGLRTGLLGAILASLAFALTAHTDTPRGAPADKPGAPQTYVILVGISKYADKQIKPRPHAEADALALYNLFTNKDHLDTSEKNVKLLLGTPQGKAEPATRANFLDSLRWLVKEARPEDKVILAFIGQGGPLGESGDRQCYFLSDSTMKDRNTNAVSADEIDEILKKLKSKHMCTFLDVDLKGFVEAPGTSIAEPTLGKAPYREFLGDDGTDDHRVLPGRAAFLATNGLTPSLDLEKHGVFTTALLEALSGKADKEGDESDGLVTVDELARYLNKRLPELCRKHGKDEKERDQLHWSISGAGTHFVLTTNPKEITAARTVQSKFAEMVKSGTIKDPILIQEGTTLLERTPLLKGKRQLRGAYRELVEGKIDRAKFDEKRESILESMKLKRTEANLFALKVLKAIEALEEEYVRKVEPGELVAHAIRELYTALEEKVPAQVENLLANLKSMKLIQLRDLLVEARMALGKREDLDNLEDLNIALQRMLHKLDAHTTYIDPETKRKFDDEVRGSFTGIGIQIRKDAATGALLVVTPILNSPAYKAGIQTGDLITQIIREVDSDGNPINPAEVINTDKITTNEAVKKILGQPDTRVKLMVKREGKDKPFEIQLNRGRVEIESVLGVKRKADDKWDFWVDPTNKIGYIRLSSFAHNTYRDLELIMQDLKKQGVRGLVLDLRFNPGGLLKTAIEVTDLFIDDGMIVSIRPRPDVGREMRYSGRHAGSLLDFPLVCLVNGSSASGSEIVSAALQDHNRAVIMGERSYGKGSVQNIREFEVIDPKTGENKMAEIKLTTASFWRPNGKNLNKSSTSGKDDEEWGVIPDRTIKLSARERYNIAEQQRNSETIEPAGRKEKEVKPTKDKQLEAALQYLRGQIKTASRGGVPSKTGG